MTARRRSEKIMRRVKDLQVRMKVVKHLGGLGGLSMLSREIVKFNLTLGRSRLLY
jgi:hypothetical protein